MKTLVLVRHSKSSWDNLLLSDFDRPLNERGKEEAPLMAKRIKERKVEIECFVSSPAKRAKKTAKIFMKTYGKDKKKLVLLPTLYEASAKDFYDAVEQLNDKFDCVAIFSHNPGITDFVNTLTDYSVDNIPTSGVFAVSIPIESWRDFRDSKKELLFFDFPKKGNP